MCLSHVGKKLEQAPAFEICVRPRLCASRGFSQYLRASVASLSRVPWFSHRAASLLLHDLEHLNERFLLLIFFFFQLRFELFEGTELPLGRLLLTLLAIRNP